MKEPHDLVNFMVTREMRDDLRMLAKLVPRRTMRAYLRSLLEDAKTREKVS